MTEVVTLFLAAAFRWSQLGTHSLCTRGKLFYLSRAWRKDSFFYFKQIDSIVFNTQQLRWT